MLDGQTAILGLGGNLGEPIKAMAKALQTVDAHDRAKVLAVSRLYRTPPWGKTDQSFFFNACARIETNLLPEDLLDLCLSIERMMKRERVERWGPRTLDIDILTYGHLEQKSERLTLPHPRMTDRAFVLLPITDFAPDLLLAGKLIEQWLRSADASGIEVADPSRDWWKTNLPNN